MGYCVAMNFSNLVYYRRKSQTHFGLKPLKERNSPLAVIIENLYRSITS